MLIESLLKKLYRFKGFVYEKVRMVKGSLEVFIRPRKGSRPICSRCGAVGRQYDTQSPRRYQFVPLWGISVFFVYKPRRVDCTPCQAVVIERVPWANGKEQTTTIFQQFISHWGRRLSWHAVAREFGISWNVVYRSIKSVVAWGMQHRSLEGVTSIGVDELMTWKGHRYVTVVYQIDNHMKRLLWVGKERTAESFQRFFDSIGEQACQKIQYVCSDMWRGYLEVIRKRLPAAIHVLDRFHIIANLNRALDEVRAQEARRLKSMGDTTTLKHSRWCFLKRPKNLTRKQKGRLKELLTMNLKTVRAYLMASDFQHLWSYSSPTWAAKFIDHWTSMVMRSRIDPLKKIANQIRSHKPLILNYFHTHKKLSSGVVEALNNNAKLTMRKSYGFKSFNVLETALYHQLGQLPEPPITHRFW
jgi:transposase